MKKVPMTISGAETLKEELRQLKTIKRPQVIEAIAEARAHGDLKENAEYHAAKESQSFIEGRITEIENKLASAQVIDVTKINNQGKVIFGSTLHLINTQTKEEMIYRIVGEDEADIKHAKISVASPMARALIGKEEGDNVDVQTPSGLLNLEIDKVEYI
jgi:transcription elongation factor GreA